MTEFVHSAATKQMSAALEMRVEHMSISPLMGNEFVVSSQ
jgi:hypothetical protein